MIFLTPLFLAGLAGIAVPLLIHLLNRVQARLVEWAAMRFLRRSLTLRRRRLLLEEALVLVTRCLIVAGFALALARPFVRPGSLLPPWLILAFILLPVILIAVGVVFWQDPARRRLFVRATAAAAVLALAAAWFESARGGLGWRLGGGQKDLVIVLDASASMGIRSEGQSGFERALEEARALVEATPHADAIGLVWAGPAPRVLLKPTADRAAIRRVLDDEALRPSAGVMGLLEAFYAAASLLEEARHPEKVVVLLTDGHRAGWDFAGERRWAFLAERLKRMPVPPRLLIRRLPMPERYADAMVADLLLSRTVIGTDRPVGVEAVIANAGPLPVRPGTVELHVDDRTAGRAEVRREIPPNASERVRFLTRFETPGRHILEVKLGLEDDSLANNSAWRVADVQASLPVLLVDGAPAERFFRGAAGFLRVALMPEEEARNAGPAHAPLIRTEVKSIREFSKLETLSGYAAIVLANVARLPDPVAARLAEYVAAGGGLWIAPGERAEPEFYNGWRAPDGGLVIPARLEKRLLAPSDEPFRLDRASCSHPAFRIPAETMAQDAARLLVPVCWNLTPDPADRQARTGARLTGGTPLLVERAFGKGRILMTAIAMDRRDSNLPTLKSMVPMAHELIYDLAAARLPVLHLRPGEELAIGIDSPENPYGIDPRAVLRLGGKPGMALEAIGPVSNALAGSAVAMIGGGALVRFSDTAEPGLYRLRIPASIRAAEAGKPAPTGFLELPFSVAPSAEEAQTGALGDGDLAVARTRIGLVDAPDRKSLLTAAEGQTPGREIWRALALMALIGLLVEIALTRWVAIRRQTGPLEQTPQRN